MSYATFVESKIWGQIDVQGLESARAGQADIFSARCMAALKAEAGMADPLHFNERSRHGRLCGFSSEPCTRRSGKGGWDSASAGATGTTGAVSALPTPRLYFDLGNTAA